MLKLKLAEYLVLTPKVKDRVWRSLDIARDWTLAIFAVFIGIKGALLATESSIELKWYEWLLAPAAFSYQHLFLSLLIFALYFGIAYAGQGRRALNIVSNIVLAFAQTAFTFMHISSLKVEHILRTYPTFEMTQADGEGNIFAANLLDLTNLPYTLSGIGLSAFAIVFPVFLVRLLRLRSLGLAWRRWLIAIAVWVGLGVACEAALTSDVGVAASDPVIYYFGDLADKALAGSSSRSDLSRRYDVRPIYGGRSAAPTSELFENLGEWKKTKKNVLLFVLESSPVHQISFMRQVKVGKEQRDTTPEMRRMRKNMLTLENHYSVHPTSMNALFSIGCSLYPYPGGGIITKINPKIPCHSISEMFDDAGYKTALFHAGRFSFWAKRKFYDNRGFDKMMDATNMPGRQDAEQFKWGIEETVGARAVVDFVHKNRERSFFVQYILVFPHVPYDFPNGDFAIFPKTAPRDKYHNCLRYADSAVKAVMDGLKKDNLLNDTLVVIVGDHGEAFLEHRGNRVHSIYIYEENVHVAAALYNPLLFPTHRAAKRVTGHVDLLPTIADLVDLPRGKWWQGASLLADGVSPLTYFFANWGPELVGVRDGRFKCIYDLEKSKYELYDLKSDPKEKRNLSSQHQDRLPVYRRTLMKWRDYHMDLIPSLGK